VQWGLRLVCLAAWGLGAGGQGPEAGLPRLARCRGGWDRRVRADMLLPDACPR